MRIRVLSGMEVGSELCDRNEMYTTRIADDSP